MCLVNAKLVGYDGPIYKVVRRYRYGLVTSPLNSFDWRSNALNVADYWEWKATSVNFGFHCVLHIGHAKHFADSIGATSTSDMVLLTTHYTGLAYSGVDSWLYLPGIAVPYLIVGNLSKCQVLTAEESAYQPVG